jgi:hypothetical protein
MDPTTYVATGYHHPLSLDASALVPTINFTLAPFNELEAHWEENPALQEKEDFLKMQRISMNSNKKRMEVVEAMIFVCKKIYKPK